MSLRLVLGRREKGWCDFVSVESFQMIELMMVELIYQCDKFTYGEYDFSSMGSWSYSSEWV